MFKAHHQQRSVIFDAYRVFLGFIKVKKFDYDQSYAIYRLVRTGRTLEKATDQMKNNYLARRVKVDCFLLRWHNLVSQIMAKSQAKNDKLMRKFAIKIMSIPQEVKEYVARLWVKDCCAKHMIAFLEWRKLAHRDRFGECQELIDGRREIMRVRKEAFDKRLQEYLKRKAKHKEDQKLVVLSEKRMLAFCKEPESPLHLIHSFDCLGWPDLSFPKDADSPPVTTDSGLEYPNYKYIKGQSPLCLFMPSERVLMKIIRACCFIEKIEDLVFYLK